MKLYDWFTIFAQIVNFLILVALLRYFLFGRILRAIDARENAIKARLGEAEDKVHAAETQKQEFEKRLRELEAARDGMFSQCQQEVDRERIELTRKARADISALEEQWRSDLELERSALFQDIRGRAAGEILSVVRRALHDLAGCDLDQCAARVFLDKIGSIDGRAWKELAGQPMVVLSATELPEEMRNAIAQALGKRDIPPASVRFEQAANLGWGLELRVNGHKIAWSAEGYVDALEERLREALEKKAGEVSRTVAS
jgi:F-type H+-transporting ATPase subunit b